LIFIFQSRSQESRLIRQLSLVIGWCQPVVPPRAASQRRAGRRRSSQQERRGRPAGRPPRSADADMQMQSRTLMHGHG
jgi:hypothetical protein